MKKLSIFIIVGCIIFLAGFLRLYRIDEYLTFLGDEGRDVLRVKQMIVDGDIIFLGPTASVGGFFLGPMYYYFMAPFLWLWNLDPVGPAIMVALFGTATVYLVYYVGSKMFHPFVGTSASLLYAVSPLVIAYSRSSWNPNIVPFFSLLLIWYLWNIALYKKTKHYFIIGLIWGLSIQFHYLFGFMILFSIVWLLIFGRSEKWLRSYGLVLLGSVLTFSPFILFELWYRFPNVTAMFKFFVTGDETGFQPANYIQTVGDVLFRSFGRLLFRMPNYELWNGYPDYLIETIVFLTRTTILLGFSLLLFFSLLLLKRKPFIKLDHIVALDYKQKIASLLVLLWFIVPLLLFGLYRKGIYDYYFGIFYAVPFLVVAIVLWQMTKTRISAMIAVMLLFSLVYYNWEGRPFVFEPNRQLLQTKNVAQAVHDLAEGKPFNFAFITATNSDHAYRYFFEIWGNSPVKIENIDVDPARKSVTEQLIVMCENKECQPLGNPLWEVAGFGRAEIVDTKDVFPVRLYKLVRYTDATESARVP